MFELRLEKASLVLVLAIALASAGCAPLAKKASEVGQWQETFAQYQSITERGGQITLSYAMRERRGHETHERWSVVDAADLNWHSTVSRRSEVTALETLFDHPPVVNPEQVIPVVRYDSYADLIDAIDNGSVHEKWNGFPLSAHVVRAPRRPLGDLRYRERVVLARRGSSTPGKMEFAVVRVPPTVTWTEPWAYPVHAILVPVALVGDIFLQPLYVVTGGVIFAVVRGR